MFIEYHSLADIVWPTVASASAVGVFHAQPSAQSKTSCAFRVYAMAMYQVQGGERGIIVRGTADLVSPQLGRVSTGAILKEVELCEGRMSYELVSGTGAKQKVCLRCSKHLDSFAHGIGKCCKCFGCGWCSGMLCVYACFCLSVCVFVCLFASLWDVLVAESCCESLRFFLFLRRRPCLNQVLTPSLSQSPKAKGPRSSDPDTNSRNLGAGPAKGWVTMNLKGKDLLLKLEKEPLR